VYRVPDAAAGWQRCREVLALGGEGHTVALHTQDPDEIARFGTLPAGRILVNTPALFGGMGYSAEVDPSFQLGTGTWSGSICSDNVTPLHLINIKRIAHEIRPWRTVYDPVDLR
jgi:acetaldehyde dehydrogenase (acetylating)